VGCGLEVGMILNQIKLYLVGVAAFLLTVFGVYLKRSGRKEAENEQMRRRIDAMKTAKDVRDDVESDDFFVDRARRNWVRSDDER